MGFVMKKLSCLLILSAALSSTAWGACKVPDSPRKPPDGKTATKEQMLTAKKQFELFDKNIEAYRACIKEEYETRLKKNPKGDDKLKEEFMATYKTANDKAVEEGERVSGNLNRELRAYQCHQQGKTDKCDAAK
jgi:hypothetical protein